MVSGRENRPAKIFDGREARRLDVELFARRQSDLDEPRQRSARRRDHIVVGELKPLHALIAEDLRSLPRERLARRRALLDLENDGHRVGIRGAVRRIVEIHHHVAVEIEVAIRHAGAERNRRSCGVGQITEPRIAAVPRRAFDDSGAEGLACVLSQAEAAEAALVDVALGVEALDARDHRGREPGVTGDFAGLWVLHVLANEHHLAQAASHYLRSGA